MAKSEFILESLPAAVIGQMVGNAEALAGL